MAAYEDPRIYEESVSADQRRDLPYFENTTGTVIAGGATGNLAWASDGNRKSWCRKDADGDAYIELEVLNATSIRVKEATELGDDTTRDVTVAAGGTYTTLVPGVSVVLHSSLTAGHIARVYPATFALDSGAMYVPRDQASDWQKYAVYNAGASVDWLLCVLQVMRATWFTPPGTGNPLAGFRSTVVNATADTYAVTVSDGTISGKKFTFTGAFNTYIVDNVAAGSTGNAIGASGLTFDAGAAPANTDTATCYVDDGADCVELCPDNAGVADEANKVTWNSSTGVRLSLSRPGYTDQRIPVGQTIYFWKRINPGASFGIGRAIYEFYLDHQRAA